MSIRRPYANVVVGCSWLQCMPWMPNRYGNNIPVFYSFDLVTRQWTQLNLCSSPDLYKNGRISYHQHAEGLARAQFESPQLLAIPHYNDNDHIVVLYGLSHPLRLIHPEASADLGHFESSLGHWEFGLGYWESLQFVFS